MEKKLSIRSIENIKKKKPTEQMLQATFTLSNVTHDTVRDITTLLSVIISAMRQHDICNSGQSILMAYLWRGKNTGSA